MTGFRTKYSKTLLDYAFEDLQILLFRFRSFAEVGKTEANVKIKNLQTPGNLSFVTCVLKC